MRKTIIILLLFIAFIANAGIKEAMIYYNSGKYINAIDEYKQILLAKADDTILYQAILGLGNSYHELGIEDKAIFYFSKYLEKIKNDTILQRVIDILIARQDYDTAIVYADEMSDDINRLRKRLDIFTAKDDRSNMAKTLVSYYDRTKDIMILARLMKLSPERAVKWDHTLEYRFIDKIMKNNIDEANAYIEDFIKKQDSLKVSSIVRFLENTNKTLAIRPAEFLYEKGKTSFDFSRLAKLYFDTGAISKLNDLIDEHRRLLGDKRFIESSAGILLNFGMYEKFIRIIKSNREYYKDKTLRVRLLDVLKSGMSFSKFFDELIFLYNKKIMDKYQIQREIKTVIKTSHRWPEAYLKHEISDLMPEDLKLLSYYLTGDKKDAKEIFKKSTPSVRAFFLKDTDAYLEFSDYINEKDDFEIFSKACDFFSDKRLKDFSDVDIPLRYFLKSLETLLKRGTITVERIKVLTEKHKDISELKKRLLDQIATIGIRSGKFAINTGNSIILEVTDLFLLYRIYYVSRKQKMDAEISSLCKTVVSLATYIYFEKKDYKKVMSLYNQVGIPRDELVFISMVLDGIDIENYIKGMTNWKLLDIYETSLEIKDKEKLEKVLRGKL
ncbi:MAG: hypothetical protein C0601_00580 [Candidatus Muiribacterium halophilum]|uniref:Uncharacterized protein n=1 Tax=Muiribacterium halophilum TaxID=2053465 RepID=A0A2N5ZMN0_MUIH1|nr:MAG: hypothetical protein C0601_00580 [Candidatus Muirbacterium halophilum]